MKKAKRCSVRPIGDLHPKLLADLKSRGLLRCHEVVPRCNRPPAGEFCRRNGMRSLLCREHLAAECEQYGVPVPVPSNTN